MSEANANTSPRYVDVDPVDAQRRRGLRRMKAVATGLLLLMAAVFTATWLLPVQPPWVGYLRAFTEAAMVGALADWFAVTALFRHPLGLPIPHTAIIPRGKDQLGNSLATFVRRNFLTPEVIGPKLADIDFAQRTGEWLARGDNAARLTRDAGALMIWLLDVIDNAALRRFLDENLHLSLRRIEASPLLARLLSMVTVDDRHQGLVDVAVRIAREQLNENRYSIRARIGERSPWWLPGFVDEEIYDKIIGEVYALLDQVGDNPEHPARRQFNDAMRDFIRSLSDDPDMVARGEELKRDILNHPEVRQYLAHSWSDLRRFVRAQIDEPDSGLNLRLFRGLQRLGESLKNDARMRGQINGWVTDALLYCVERYREPMSAIISDTVQSWDARATSERIELQVGRDLQFIRINGTLVGGLAGLAIHALVELLRH